MKKKLMELIWEVMGNVDRGDPVIEQLADEILALRSKELAGVFDDHLKLSAEIRSLRSAGLPVRIDAGRLWAGCQAYHEDNVGYLSGDPVVDLGAVTEVVKDILRSAKVDRYAVAREVWDEYIEKHWGMDSDFGFGRWTDRKAGCPECGAGESNEPCSDFCRQQIEADEETTAYSEYVEAGGSMTVHEWREWKKEQTTDILEAGEPRQFTSNMGEVAVANIPSAAAVEYTRIAGIRVCAGCHHTPVFCTCEATPTNPFPKDGYTVYRETGGALNVNDWLLAGKPEHDQAGRIGG